MIYRPLFLLIIAAAASCVSAGFVEALQALARRQTSTTPRINSVQNWSNDFADVDFDLGANGSFTVDWNNGFGGNFVVGRGYQPGRDMLVNYTGTFRTTGAAYLALYGWTRNPLVEYYVIEAMGNHNPSDNVSSTQYGCLQSDGATYEIWQKERINAPSIDGDHTNFQQYWSVRTSMHVGGTINTGNHFRAWAAAGLKLGTQVYMDIVIEGQRGSGSANITVGQLPSTNVPNTPTPTRRTEHAPGSCPRTTATATTSITTVPTSTTTTTVATTTTTTAPTSPTIATELPSTTAIPTETSVST